MHFRRAPFANDHALVFNIISLIDILLVLLAYLILTMNHAPAGERTTEIELPTTSTESKKPARPPLLIVNVSRSGELTVNGKTLTEEALIGKLQQLEQLTGEQAVVIRGDKGASYDHILSVLEACNSAGVATVGFTSRKPEGTSR